MREIKFRGKRIDTGEWVYGDLVRHSKISPFTFIGKGTGYKVDDPEQEQLIKVYPDSVGQYTGLKDKNGTPIYEGDIVQAKDPKKGFIATPFIGRVYWLDSEYQWWISDGTNDPINGVDDDLSYLRYFDDCEVIGNIYEHPELMEVKE